MNFDLFILLPIGFGLFVLHPVNQLDLHPSKGFAGYPYVLCAHWFSTLHGAFGVTGQVESFSLSMPLLQVLSFLHKPGTIMRAPGGKLLLLLQKGS